VAASELLPRLVTQAQLETERPAILAWAAKYGWSVGISPADRMIRVGTSHPAAGVALTGLADCAWYPSAAPAWQFVNAAGASARSAYPAPGNTPGISGSIFHRNGLICAPWNRLAYGELGGVHSDWGGIVNWKTAARGYTQAHTIADMLQALMIHLMASPGMMP
jgi:hypothetical protein